MSTPIAILISAWESARAQWFKAVEQDEDGNFATPECLFWRAEIDRLANMIEAAPIQTQQDAAAIIRYIWIDADADTDDRPQVRRSVLAKVQAWAVSA